MRKTISIVGANWNLGQCKRGVEKGPDLFRKNQLVSRIEKLGYQVQDKGNICKESQFIEDQNKKLSQLGFLNQKLYQLTLESLKNQELALTIGGDHSCATGSIYAGLELYRQNYKILWVDAHTDINTIDSSPTKNYHGMPVSHLLELDSMKRLKNFEWKKDVLDPKNIIYLGIRDLDEAEKKYIKDLNIKYFTPYDVDKAGGIQNVMEEIIDYLDLEKQNNKLHLSFDVDSCSSSYLSGTGTPVDYGLSKREIIYMMQEVHKSQKLVSFDVVEVNQDLEVSYLNKVFGDDNLAQFHAKSLRYSQDFMEYGLGRRDDF